MRILNIGEIDVIHPISKDPLRLTSSTFHVYVLEHDNDRFNPNMTLNLGEFDAEEFLTHLGFVLTHTDEILPTIGGFIVKIEGIVKIDDDAKEKIEKILYLSTEPLHILTNTPNPICW